jgi:flagellar assembly factor FliW
MEIKSKLLGNQEIDPSSIIIFPKGIPGFDNEQRFKLFHQENSDVVYWLQSLDNEDLTFSVAHPARFHINYSFVLSDDEEKLLDIEEGDDLLIMILLHKEDSEQSTHSKPTIKGSIKAPLVINSNKRLGMQKIFAEIEQSITLAEKSSEIHVLEA